MADSINITLGDLKVRNVNGLAPSDFPVMTVDQWSHTFTMPTADLARGFGRTEFAISSEETRYYLNGVYMHHMPVNGSRGTLRFVATDGHRLAACDMDSPEGATSKAVECPYTGDVMIEHSPMPGVIVPRKAVHELLRLVEAKGAPVTVDIRVNGTKIEFVIGGVTLLSKAIDGTFPDYQRTIPDGNDKRLVINAEAMADAIKQVSVMSSERGRVVKLSLERDALRLSVSNPDAGMAEISVDADYGSDPFDIGFNSGYMLDILDQCESETVEFMLADAGSPTLIRGTDDGDKGLRYVLMPLRV